MKEDRSFHDLAHINHVVKNGRQLIQKLGGDETVIITALLFHDIRRDTDNHEKVGAEETKKLLTKLDGFPKKKIQPVYLTILHHADKIDAFTNLGIARGFMMLAKKDFKLHNGIKTYLKLINEWYKDIYFNESKKIANKGYNETKIFLENLLSQYEFSYQLN